MKSIESELKIFGNNVKEYRILKGLTQEQLAESISVSSVQIGRIETGKNACTIQTLLKLCRILNITPNDLFKDIQELPLSSDNSVYINNFISTHQFDNEETKEFFKSILSKFAIYFYFLRLYY